MIEHTVIEAGTGPAADAAKKAGAGPKSVILYPYPKIIFLYPTFLTALAAGLYMWFVGDTAMMQEDPLRGQQVAVAFLAVLGLNLVVLSFDFPRTTSLTLFFFGVAVGVGLWALFRFNPGLLPAVTDVLRRLDPVANSTFYFLIAVILALIYVGMFISVRFDYWEVRPNELLHRHGILSNLKRFPAPRMRIDKEIDDVFEYLLLRSGRLILHPSNEPRAIVLENIPFISRKEAEITRMLGALQVQVRREEVH